MPKSSPPLSSVLPPLVFGTATFNSQYNKDPFELPTTKLVEKALCMGIRAFDTSPYYGPAEELLGIGLDRDFVRANFPRSEYYLLTKVGRISSHQFDYSASWVRQSVERSCARLRTTYLDVVYCHDVEFVSPTEVLEAVTELRRLRDTTGAVRYVGICGYPLDTLCALSEMILRETGEPLDVVQSYANYTLQNRTLLTRALPRFRAAGVDVVPNASMLGMGLLRREGVPLGGQGDWHPAPVELRKAVRAASDYCDTRGDKIEKVAIRFAVDNWLRDGAPVGSKGDPASGIPWRREDKDAVGAERLGVSVMGVSTVFELDETVAVWRSILAARAGPQKLKREPGRQEEEYEWSVIRSQQVKESVREIAVMLGDWLDYAWESPPADFVNQRRLDEKKGEAATDTVSAVVTS